MEEKKESKLKSFLEGLVVIVFTYFLFTGFVWPEIKLLLSSFIVSMQPTFAWDTAAMFFLSVIPVYFFAFYNDIKSGMSDKKKIKKDDKGKLVVVTTKDVVIDHLGSLAITIFTFALLFYAIFCLTRVILMPLLCFVMSYFFGTYPWCAQFSASMLCHPVDWTFLVLASIPLFAFLFKGNKKEETK